MNWRSNSYLLSLSFAVFLLIIAFIGFQVEREDFTTLIVAFFLVFTIMIYWYKSHSFQEEKTIWALVIISRLILLFSVPLLSDDYFRFIWDGHIQVQGINPFEFLPGSIEVNTFLAEIYNGLNSKEYFSVYPPVMQFVFWLSSLIAGDNIALNIIVLKGFLLIADLGLIYGVIRVLKMLGKKIKPVIFLALNPLLIMEVVGNLHFESMMMCFTVWSIFLLIRWEKNKKHSFFILTAFVFSLGVLTKIVSLLLLPILIRKLGLKNSIYFGLMVLVFTVLAFLPFADPQVIQNFSNSLDLYFRKFEFNASIYFITNGIYEKFVGWQEIKFVGPALALTNVFVILILSLRRKITSWEMFFTTAMMVMTAHLLFSTTVHPWYIINILVLAVFTTKRYVVVWSFTVILSYYFYQKLQIPFWLIAIEYCLFLGYLIYEAKFKTGDSPQLKGI
ncbi:MAG: alpha-1,6-mannosyltransferase [Patiriisocius sp.]|jgi:alpha-1,6-mannosyltransferase